MKVITLIDAHCFIKKFEENGLIKAVQKIIDCIENTYQ